MLYVGNGWLREDPASGFEVEMVRNTPRWRGVPHPVYGLLAEHGPDVPPVFFLKFRYPVQTAASYGFAEPQAITAPVITWISRN